MFAIESSIPSSSSQARAQQHGSEADALALKKEKRRLQNRLAQQRFRQRIKLNAEGGPAALQQHDKVAERDRRCSSASSSSSPTSSPSNQPSTPSTASSECTADFSNEEKDMLVSSIVQSVARIDTKGRGQNIVDRLMSDDNVRNVIASRFRTLSSSQRVSAAILYSLIRPTPDSSFEPLYLPRLQFIHAMFKNAERMGLSQDIMNNCESISTVGEAWSRLKSGQTNSSPDSFASATDLYSPDVPSIISDEASSENLYRSAYSFVPELSESTEQLLAQKRAALQRRAMCPQPCRPSNQLVQVDRWRLEGIPENMHPTELQMSVSHHPFIDVAFPWPSMREKILLFMGVGFNREEFCESFMDASANTSEPAITIWGDDMMDPEAFEVSEPFARQWWFLLDQSIIKRSNWWRRQRGLPPIENEWIL